MKNNYYILKNLRRIIMALSVVIPSISVYASIPTEQVDSEVYQLKTVHYTGEGFEFRNSENFDEALKDGVFCIKRPDDVNIEEIRELANNFITDPTCLNFSSRSSKGYIKSEDSQAIRFTLESDDWSFYPENIRMSVNNLQYIGINIIKSILEKSSIPTELYFKATGGAIDGEGSYYMLLNYYDHKLIKPMGLKAHTDWGLITILDVVSDGLQVETDGTWRTVSLEDGYLIVMVGESLKKLLPDQLNACNHRVLPQTEHPRTSVGMFINTRIGPFRERAKTKEKEGMISQWDPRLRTLVNPVSMAGIIAEASQRLYGELSK